MVRLEPPGKGAVTLLQRQDGPGVLDGGVDFETIADDPRISHETADIPRPEPRHDGGIESFVGGLERRLFFQNGKPGQTRLVDLQHEPFEEGPVISNGKPVLGIVVRPVPFMSRCYIAV